MQHIIKFIGLRQMLKGFSDTTKQKVLVGLFIITWKFAEVLSNLYFLIL